MTKHTDDSELAVRRQFSSFCKSVIHNAAIDFIRLENRKSDYCMTPIHSLTEADQVTLAVEDTYDFEYESISIGGMDMKLNLKNEKLSEAIMLLTERQREEIITNRLFQQKHLKKHRKSEIVEMEIENLRHLVKERNTVDNTHLAVY